MTLSFEKAFVHAQFTSNVESLTSLDSAKKLLIDLHHLHLSQQEVFKSMLKQSLDKEWEAMIKRD